MAQGRKPKSSPSGQRPDPHDDWQSAYADLDRRYQSLANDMAMMRWVMGFGFALVIITIGIVVQSAANVSRENAAILDRLHQHELDSEIHHNH